MPTDDQWSTDPILSFDFERITRCDQLASHGLLVGENLTYVCLHGHGDCIHLDLHSERAAFILQSGDR